MPPERIWLHIGAEKTGTTSIQGCLQLNRDRLLAKGVLFPRAPGDFNHMALAAYAMADEKGIEEMRMVNGVRSMDDLPAFRGRLRDELHAEIAASGAHTVILSNEHCSSRLKSPGEVGQIFDLLSPICADVRVVLYIRDPVSFYESWYSTAIASGNTFGFPELKPGLLRAADWLAMAQRWSATFGSAEVVVRRMEPGKLVSDDLLTDFFHTVEMPGFAFERGPRRNESLPLEPLLFLRELNERLPRFVDGQISHDRGHIVDVLRRWPDKRRFRLSAEQAAAIRAHFEPSYERLRRICFPLDEGPLFADEGRDAPPEQITELSPRDIYELTAFLWKGRQGHGSGGGKRRSA